MEIHTSLLAKGFLKQILFSNSDHVVFGKRGHHYFIKATDELAFCGEFSAAWTAVKWDVLPDEIPPVFFGDGFSLDENL